MIRAQSSFSRNDTASLVEFDGGLSEFIRAVEEVCLIAQRHRDLAGNGVLSFFGQIIGVVERLTGLTIGRTRVPRLQEPQPPVGASSSLPEALF